MHVIHAFNVNDAYEKGISFLRGVSRTPEPSRNGPVYRSPMPVTTVYMNPDQRVLFDVVRDANPFFHFLEGLWMLGGRNDAAWIKEFAANMASYSDDGETLNGAYGYRWRSYFLYDQIPVVVNLLRNDFSNRRVVMGMWNPHRDLVDQTSKDLPCNLGIKFFGRIDPRGVRVLDMHVYNRSNDIIWGAYGANAVHMSMLHEYIASMVGVKLGIYYQISSDFHAYLETFEKVTAKGYEPSASHTDLYRGNERVFPSPLVSSTKHFDSDLDHFLEDRQEQIKYANQSISDAGVMRNAWRAHKAKATDKAIGIAMGISASDWRIACLGWLQRRLSQPTTKETVNAPAKPKED